MILDLIENISNSIISHNVYESFFINIEKNDQLLKKKLCILFSTNN